MHVLKSRWLALAAICLSLTLVSGCQIDSSTGVQSDFRYLKIAPDLNLKATPEGYVYEMWLLSFNQEIIVDGDSVIIIVEPGEPVSVARFRWDPYLYAASDAQGNYLDLTAANGMRLSFDPNPLLQAEVVVGFMTLEDEGDNNGVPDGPNIVAARINAISGNGKLFNAFQLLTEAPRQDGYGGFGMQAPIASYRLMSQSNKKGVPGANWRDGETEGYGIWFANPRLDPVITLDEATGWDAYTRTFVPDDGEAYAYSVWIHRTQPESSFSNFGQVLLNREPDFDYTDGVITHPDGRFGPSEPITRNAPLAPLPGVNLGSDPVVINGVTVGYRYIVSHPGTPNANPPVPPHVDTCVIRIDDPSLTRCNRDTFNVLQFDDVGLLAKTYRNSIGDTSIGSSLGSLLDLSDIQALNEATFGNAFIFLGWEYEAWLIFTDESGIPPMSLGRFKSPTDIDENNPYTFTDSRYDRNFQVPGEDFLQNLSSHHPSLTGPLDVIHEASVEKLWITIEPDDDFFGVNYDPAPDEPNTQFIYLSAFIPKSLDSTRSASVPLVHRDRNPSPSGLNEGNNFPVVTIQFLPEPVE